MNTKKGIGKKLAFTLNIYSILSIISAIIINCIGHVISEALSLPVRLDTIGTIFSAVQFGPIAGSIVGAVSSLIFTIFTSSTILYALVGISVGALFGFLFPRDHKIELLAVVSIAMLAGFITTFISLPINVHFYDGMTGNVWGDALYKMLSNTIHSKYLNLIAADAFISVPDRIISTFIALYCVELEEKRFLKKQHKKWSSISSAMLMLLLCAGVLSPQMLPASALSGDISTSEYSVTRYGKEDGIMVSEINAVAQTDDGYIWVGTYSGLYVFDGIKFEKADIAKDINSVMSMIAAPDGRLWIGTNDSGVFCYDTVSMEVQGYDTSSGLKADSIRAIGVDTNGSIYIGTVLDISRIDKDGNVKTYSDWEDITYAVSFSTLKDGRVAGVTRDGVMFLIKDDMLLDTEILENDASDFFRSVAYSGSELLVGTNSDLVCRYRLEGDSFKYVDSLTSAGQIYCNDITYDAVQDKYFICYENGLGYIDGNDHRFTDLSQSSFSGAVSDVCIDNQGNIWFASSKNGLIKYSKNPFENINAKVGLGDRVVNAVLLDGNMLYIGCDDGLEVADIKNNKIIDKSYHDIFEGARIRNIFKDSRSNIWVSTYGETGLVCIGKNDELTAYSGAELGMTGGRCRSVIELSDGRILLAGNDGLTYISNRNIDMRIGSENGLNNKIILSTIEREDGSVLAGSDGDGIYIIKNDVVVGHIGESEGLGSSVVLRIVKSTEGGYFYVTSNALYYDNGSDIKKLESFPYTNNYDIIITDDGMCWVTSSAGIFIVPESELIADKGYKYTLLDENWGLNSTFSANSWNAYNGEELYLCVTDGVRRVSAEDYDITGNDYQIHLKSYSYGDNFYYTNDGTAITIPAFTGRIDFNIAINNYALSDPLVHYYLEGLGLDDEGITCNQKDVIPLSFTNLPAGKYKLHIQVLDEAGSSILKERIIDIEKQAEMYEKLYFRIYLMTVSAFFVMYIAWVVYTFNRRSSKIIGLQKDMMTDPMTNILNKAGIKKVLTNTCRSSKGVLMMIDLDSFKLVNDIYGHEMGDRILIRFAELLKEASKEDDIMGRMGGDEFVGFIKDTLHEDDIEEFTKFMNREIVKSAKQYMGEDMNIPIGTSIGAVRVPMEGTDFEELLGLADKALYLVKQNGKHGCAFYQKKDDISELDEDTDANNIRQIKKIVGERNEGKGAYLVNFERLQLIYRYINRYDKCNGKETGFIRFMISSPDGKVPDDIKEGLEEYLITHLNKDDVVSVMSSNYFVLANKRDDLSCIELAQTLINGWKLLEGHEKYDLSFETESVE